MAKKSLLLVDGDVRSLRVLEVSLRKAGYNLTTCSDAAGALETLEYAQPDLILSDTRLPGMDGFALVEALRQNADWATIPIIFLSSDTSVESKVRGLQLGVEDYLTKPIYTKEILARIHLSLNRRERDSFARRNSLSKTRFTGSLEDMGLVDLLQTIDVSRKSGVLELRSAAGRGTITFREGQVLDAEVGRIHGERAIYRLLLWSEGDFDIEFRAVKSEALISTPTTGLLMEGMRRVDEWGRLLEQVPPLETVVEVVDDELLPRLAEIPDELNPVLRAIDGRRTLGEVIDEVSADDLTTLSTLSKLFFEGVVQPRRGSRTLRPEAPDDDALIGELEPGLHDEPRSFADGGAETVPGRASVVPPPMHHGDEDLLAIRAEARSAAFEASHGTMTARDDDASATDERPISLAPPPVVLPPAPAVPSFSNVPEVSTPGRSPKTTLVGPGFDADTEKLLASIDTARGLATEASSNVVSRSDAAAAPSDKRPEPPPNGSPASPPHEDSMAKKNKKNKGDRNSLSPKSEAPKAETKVEAKVEAPVARPEPKVEEKPLEKRDEKREEAASNVIQFPTQAKRSVTQVAVNGGALEEEDEPEEARSDETRPRLRTDEADEAKSDASEKAPTDEKATAKDEKATAKADKPSERADKVSERPAKSSEPPKADDRKERRQKKAHTDSGEIRALGTGEHAAVTEDFFQAKDAPAEPEHDDFSDLQRSLEPISADSKQWMRVTLGIVVGALLLFGGYEYYNKFVLPQPAALGQGGPLELPQLRGAPPPPPAPEVTSPPAPEVTSPAPAPEAPVAEAVAPEAVAPEVVAVAPQAEVPAPAPVPAAVVPPPAPAAPAAPAETYESVLAQATASRRPAQSVPLFERAIELNPNGVEALSQLSYILLQRPGRPNTERARDLSQRAVGADPTNSLGWLVLGAAREMLGDRAGSRQAFQSCVAQGQGRWVRDCRASL